MIANIPPYVRYRISKGPFLSSEGALTAVEPTAADVRSWQETDGWHVDYRLSFATVAEGEEKERDLAAIQQIHSRHEGKHPSLFNELLGVFAKARHRGETPEQARETVRRVYLQSIGAGGAYG